VESVFEAGEVGAHNPSY